MKSNTLARLSQHATNGLANLNATPSTPMFPGRQMLMSDFCKDADDEKNNENLPGFVVSDVSMDEYSEEVLPPESAFSVMRSIPLPPSILSVPAGELINPICAQDDLDTLVLRDKLAFQQGLKRDAAAPDANQYGDLAGFIVPDSSRRLRKKVHPVAAGVESILNVTEVTQSKRPMFPGRQMLMSDFCKDADDEKNNENLPGFVVSDVSMDEYSEEVLPPESAFSVMRSIPLPPSILSVPAGELINPICAQDDLDTLVLRDKFAFQQGLKRDAAAPDANQCGDLAGFIVPDSSRRLRKKVHPIAAGVESILNVTEVTQSKRRAALASRKHTNTSPFAKMNCCNDTKRVTDDFGGRYFPSEKLSNCDLCLGRRPKEITDEKWTKHACHCLFCNRRKPKNKTFQEWKTHVNSEHSVPCPFEKCHRTFVSAYDRENHVRNIHMSAEVCSKCRLKRNRSHHDWQKHVLKKQHVPCPRCRLFFTKDSHMELHLNAVHKARSKIGIFSHKTNPPTEYKSSLQWLSADVFLSETSTETHDIEDDYIEDILKTAPEVIEDTSLVRQHTQKIRTIFEKIHDRHTEQLKRKKVFCEPGDQLSEGVIEVESCQKILRLKSKKYRKNIKTSRRKKLASVKVELHALVSEPLSVIAQTKYDVLGSFNPGGTKHGKLVIDALSKGRWFRLKVYTKWIEKCVIVMVNNICILSIVTQAICMDVELVPSCDGTHFKESHDLVWPENHRVEKQTLRLIFHSDFHKHTTISQIIQNMKYGGVKCTFSVITPRTAVPSAYKLLHNPEYFRLLCCLPVELNEFESLVFVDPESGKCFVCNSKRRIVIDVQMVDKLPRKVLDNYAQYNSVWQNFKLDQELFTHPLCMSTIPGYLSNLEAARAKAIERNDCSNLCDAVIQLFKLGYKMKSHHSLFNPARRGDALFNAKCISEWRPYTCAECLRKKWWNNIAIVPIKSWARCSVRKHANCIPGIVCKTCHSALTPRQTPPLDFGEIPPEVKKLTMYQRAGLSSLEPTNALRRSTTVSGNCMCFNYLDGKQSYFLKLSDKQDTARGIVLCEPNMNEQQRRKARQFRKEFLEKQSSSDVTCPVCNHIITSEVGSHIEICFFKRGQTKEIVAALEALRKIDRDPARIPRNVHVENMLKKQYEYLLKRYANQQKQNIDPSSVVVCNNLPDGAPHGIAVPFHASPIEKEDPVRGILRLGNNNIIAVYDNCPYWEKLCFPYLYLRQGTTYDGRENCTLFQHIQDLLLSPDSRFRNSPEWVLRDRFTTDFVQQRTSYSLGLGAKIGQ